MSQNVPILPQVEGQGPFELGVLWIPAPMRYGDYVPDKCGICNPDWHTGTSSSAGMVGRSFVGTSLMVIGTGSPVFNRDVIRV